MDYMGRIQITFSLIVKPRANARNVVCQQDATLLGPTCCERFHTMLCVVATWWMKFETGQTSSNNSNKSQQHAVKLLLPQFRIPAVEINEYQMVVELLLPQWIKNDKSDLDISWCLYSVFYVNLVTVGLREKHLKTHIKWRGILQSRPASLQCGHSDHERLVKLHPTTSNKSQQHATTHNMVYTETLATCWVQQCCVLLANNVASVCTGL